ncbi:hypothetical protein QQF64_017050 [Cirrhinus molitorella]|uniref:Uncharacterized protein n=1 Tax=Cirrhinus molitorella TaxID=172907 RepID=A0ABR3LL70_9TELE
MNISWVGLTVWSSSSGFLSAGVDVELLSRGYWQSAAGQFPSADLLEGHHLRTNPQEIRAALSSSPRRKISLNSKHL